MASIAFECAHPSSTDIAVTHVDKTNHVGGVYPRWLSKKVPYEVLSHIFILCSDLPVELLYFKTMKPCQVILSQVCSEWRQVAFSTGALWSNITISGWQIDNDFTHCLSLYQTCIDRAGAHPLIITLDLSSDRTDLQHVFEHFVLPFRIKMLDITLMYADLLLLSNVQTLNVEESAISLRSVQRMGDFAVPPFMDKTRALRVRGSDTEWFPAMFEQLCLPWDQLRLLECDSPAVPLSSSSAKHRRWSGAI
jgi:hypothetical protein